MTNDYIASPAGRRDARVVAISGDILPKYQPAYDSTYISQRQLFNLTHQRLTNQRVYTVPNNAHRSTRGLVIIGGVAIRSSTTHTKSFDLKKKYYPCSLGVERKNSTLA